MKRAISIILACMLTLLALPAAAFSTESYKNGDVNQDKRLSIRDATYIQYSILGLIVLTDEQKALADFDLNGEINILDATKIQKVLVELEESPVEPTTAETQPATTNPIATTVPTTAPLTTPTTAPTTPTEPKVKSNIDIYFTNNKNWTDVYFYLYNSATDTEAAQWPGVKVTDYTTNDYGEQIYKSTVDVSKWDRIIFNNNSTQQTVNTAISKASSGFFIKSGSGKTMVPGIYAATGADAGKIVTTTLQYSTGYNKKIWIWTPADYSATDTKKYKTLYIMDGQNLFDADHSDSFGGWQVTDAVESLMANGGRGMIIVGIDNGNSKRDSELTPDIGNVKPQYQSDFGVRTGEAFSNFVVEKVMPYVQSNYNSSTAAKDNAIIGSSSGGLESFYIGMENMDKFGHIGALSPAFALFSESVWNTYLSKYDLTSENMPRLYIYNGNNDSVEKELYADTVAMYNKLTKDGYNSEKITLVLEEEAKHNEGYWRLIFPEMLCWCYQP